MTIHEFILRTKVEVSEKEFNAINQVYMDSDCDKDEFCRLWCKMNKSRVRKAKDEAESKEKVLIIKEKLFDIIEKYNDFHSLAYAYCALKEKDALFLEGLGFDLHNTEFGGLPLVSDAVLFSRLWIANN